MVSSDQFMIALPECAGGLLTATDEHTAEIQETLQTPA